VEQQWSRYSTVCVVTRQPVVGVWTRSISSVRPMRFFSCTDVAMEQILPVNTRRWHFVFDVFFYFYFSRVLTISQRCWRSFKAPETLNIYELFESV